MDESDILMAMESGQEVCSLHQVIYQSEGDEIHLEDKLEQQADLIEQTVDNIYVQELLKKTKNARNARLSICGTSKIRPRRRLQKRLEFPRYRYLGWRKKY